jgi:hypothetical protein
MCSDHLSLARSHGGSQHLPLLFLLCYCRQRQKLWSVFSVLWIERDGHRNARTNKFTLAVQRKEDQFPDVFAFYVPPGLSPTSSTHGLKCTGRISMNLVSFPASHWWMCTWTSICLVQMISTRPNISCSIGSFWNPMKQTMKVRSLGLNIKHTTSGMCWAPPCRPSIFWGGQGGMRRLHLHCIQTTVYTVLF